MTADAEPIDWLNLNGDDFVRVTLDDGHLWRFVALYRRHGFKDDNIRQMVWSKSQNRWRPTWETIESIATDQQKAADANSR